MKLQARLEKLESAFIPESEPLAIFRNLVGANDGNLVNIPLFGWKVVGKDGIEMEIKRLSDESDADLQTRAAGLAFAKFPNKQALRLTSINDKEKDKSNA